MPLLIADDGARLHYVSHGSGPVCLIGLHWMGGEAANWEALGRALDPQRFRLVALDFRGHGQSQRERSDFSTERLARDVLGLADALGVERFFVAGHSYGGKVALQLAALAPRRVAGLVLLGAVGPGLVPLERAMIEEMLPKCGDVAFVREVFHPWFRAGERPEVERALAAVARTPEWALRAVCEAALWTDLTREIAPTAIPALAIAGADDPVYGPAYQSQAVLPFVPGAQAVTIAACGHGLILERPEEIAAHVARFLERAG